MEGARVLLSSKGVSRGMKLNAEQLRLHDARSYKSGFLAATLGVFTFAAVNCNGLTASQSTTEAIWPTNGWQTSTPEEQGMDSADLAGLVDFGTKHSLDSLLITRHGKIVTEAYYAPYEAGIPHAVNSVTKAVISTLTAIAWKDGLLDSPDHKVLDFFDSHNVANVNNRKAAVRVQNLLDMTSGFDWTEPLYGYPASMVAMERSPDWVKFVLDRTMPNAPGDVL
jgi:CubicO group peptidase (beta-lactamase class C family)